MGECPFQIQATACARTLLDVISTASCVFTNLHGVPMSAHSLAGVMCPMHGHIQLQTELGTAKAGCAPNVQPKGCYTEKIPLLEVARTLGLFLLALSSRCQLE